MNRSFVFDNTYLALPEFFYSKILPRKVLEPKLVIFNEELAEQLEIDLSDDLDQLAKYFCGNLLLQGSVPFAQSYAGHQYGHFVVLGDGRAHVLGEHITFSGRRYDIQLKGSGRTYYSRQADGKAALGPMLREYIISEAMNGLCIPTTRSLAVVLTGESVIRERELPGAVLTRVASSHLRIGTFEFAARCTPLDSLRALMDYAIGRHYPELVSSPSKALEFLNQVIERQSKLIAEWMRVGFIHGVMNTDNMTISGETIDYGPCAFMDEYKSNRVFSSIDRNGRYSFSNQPFIAQWNLARLAETLLPFFSDDIDIAVSLAEESVSAFSEIFNRFWLSMMRTKIGLIDEKNEDNELISSLLAWMEKYSADYTNTFRFLGKFIHNSLSGESRDSYRALCDTFSPYLFGTNVNKMEDKSFEEIDKWTKRWQCRIESSSRHLFDGSYSRHIEESIKKMKTANPEIIPRNHKVQEALIAAESGDYNLFNGLLEAVKLPYTDIGFGNCYQTLPTAAETVHYTYCGT